MLSGDSTHCGARATVLTMVLEQRLGDDEGITEGETGVAAFQSLRSAHVCDSGLVEGPLFQHRKPEAKLKVTVNHTKRTQSLGWTDRRSFNQLSYEYYP
ncbi:hypothetical protein JOB18_035635 [Solea senegalensis]|uniref:Uncharacterized protein n=1 Tax=Solea senegalensis TaxID=28829 RepID=A0AAV6QNS1_SOLSE|nr:hypothetical protein JOB18_035635 [Solea senegalensis]